MGGGDGSLCHELMTGHATLGMRDLKKKASASKNRGVEAKRQARAVKGFR